MALQRVESPRLSARLIEVGVWSASNSARSSRRLRVQVRFCFSFWIKRIGLLLLRRRMMFSQ